MKLKKSKIEVENSVFQLWSFFFLSFSLLTVKTLMGGLVSPRGMWSWQALLWSAGVGRERGDVGWGIEWRWWWKGAGGLRGAGKMLLLGPPIQNIHHTHARAHTHRPLDSPAHVCTRSPCRTSSLPPSHPPPQSCYCGARLRSAQLNTDRIRASLHPLALAPSSSLLPPINHSFSLKPSHHQSL